MVTPNNRKADCMLAGVSLKLPVGSGQIFTNKKFPLLILISITYRELLSVC